MKKWTYICKFLSILKINIKQYINKMEYIMSNELILIYDRHYSLIDKIRFWELLCDENCFNEVKNYVKRNFLTELKNKSNEIGLDIGNFIGDIMWQYSLLNEDWPQKLDILVKNLIWAYKKTALHCFSLRIDKNGDLVNVINNEIKKFCLDKNGFVTKNLYE